MHQGRKQKQSLNFTQGNAVLLLSARQMVQESVTCSICISPKRQQLLACGKESESAWIESTQL
jgi:hypothetical protein